MKRKCVELSFFYLSLWVIYLAALESFVERSLSFRRGLADDVFSVPEFGILFGLLTLLAH